MKIQIRLIIIALAFISLFALSNQIPKDQEIIYTDTVTNLRIYPRHIEELDENSDYVLLIEPTGESKEEIVYADTQGAVRWGLTRTQVIIKDVIRGESVNIGDQIVICESAYTDKEKEEENKKYLIATEGYRLMKKGQKYLLYLTKVRNVDAKGTGLYRIVGTYHGKFKTILPSDDIDSLGADEIELTHSNLKRYKRLYKEAKEKYPELFLSN